MEKNNFQSSQLEQCLYNNMSPPPQFNVGESSNKVEWSFEENKVFENALAEEAEHLGSPTFFQKLATLMPYKSMQDIMAHFDALVKDVEMIESGLIPIPEYKTEEDAPTLVDNLVEGTNGESGNISPPMETRSPPMETKRTSSGHRRRGIPWTEDEHELFLMGLNKYGKGDWRSISRFYVTSKTPTQIASHAQKYFRRQISTTPEDRRRPSIHDISTVGNVTYPKFVAPMSTFTPNPFATMAQTQMPFQGATAFMNNSMPGMNTTAAPMPFQRTNGFINNNFTTGMNTNAFINNNFNNFTSGMNTNAPPLPLQGTTAVINNNFTTVMNTNAAPLPLQGTTAFINNNFGTGMNTKAAPMPLQGTTAVINNNLTTGMNTNAAPLPLQGTTAFINNNFSTGNLTNTAPMPLQGTTAFFNNNFATGMNTNTAPMPLQGASALMNNYVGGVSAGFEENPDMFVPDGPVNYAPPPMNNPAMELNPVEVGVGHPWFQDWPEFEA